MTLLVAVAAAEDFRLRTLAGHMADVLAVVALTPTTTTATARVVGRLCAFRLVVATIGQRMFDAKKGDAVGDGTRADIPRTIAVVAETIGTSTATTTHRLTRLGTVGLAVSMR
jgi:hypothetical protein